MFSISFINQIKFILEFIFLRARPLFMSKRSHLLQYQNVHLDIFKEHQGQDQGGSGLSAIS